jgi:hypothetical protein
LANCQRSIYLVIGNASRPCHIAEQRMKRVLLLSSGWLMVTSSAQAATLPQLYAPQGELLLAHLASAPFPHLQRAKGHKYKDQFYAVAEHYSNDTVAIFIPKGFRETGHIDFVVHFHGWQNNVETVLGRYQLIEQLVASRRNAVLVVPQGPCNAPDSFGGKLEDPQGFARFMNEVADTLRSKSMLKLRPFVLGSIVLSGHSGGYQVISSILDHGGLTSQVKEVWLFDALYARTDTFLAWWDKSRGRLIDLYTEHGGTKEETERLMAALKERGIPFFATKETQPTPIDLRQNRLLFLFSDLPHDEVVDKHKAFEQFLTTSFLAELPPPEPQRSSVDVPHSKSAPK